MAAPKTQYKMNGVYLNRKAGKASLVESNVINMEQEMARKVTTVSLDCS